VQLLAIAGGAGPGDEDVLGCCGMIVVLPLVVFLAGRAVVRTSGWSAFAALLLAALPYLLLRLMVAGYQPSDDGDVRGDQDSGRQALGLYGWLVLVAGVSALWVVVWRLVGVRRKSAEPGGAPDTGREPRSMETRH
jgi:hypothetical protein